MPLNSEVDSVRTFRRSLNIQSHKIGTVSRRKPCGTAYDVPRRFFIAADAGEIQFSVNGFFFGSHFCLDFLFNPERHFFKG